MLIHDCQYTDEEYPAHLGWGHCPMSDALAFARRVGAGRLLLFHHDPLHSDTFLDDFARRIRRRWRELGGSPGQVELARERRELEVASAPAAERLQPALASTDASPPPAAVESPEAISAPAPLAAASALRQLAPRRPAAGAAAAQARP